jgi:peptidoglycan-associated lipoprotein
VGSGWRHLDSARLRRRISGAANDSARQLRGHYYGHQRIVERLDYGHGGGAMKNFGIRTVAIKAGRQSVRGEIRMAKRLTAIMLAGLAGFLGLAPSKASAQNIERMEIGAEYSFVKSNAPPGDCGCFTLNGADGWFAYNFTHHWAAVGEMGGGYASKIDGTTSDLTFSTFLGGGRYSRRLMDRIAPFGQFLIGAAHANGALTPDLAGMPAGANAFAVAAGGGMDLEGSRYWKLRLIEVDYLLTRFDNGVNNHQNNVRVSIGVAFRFGGGNSR